MALIQLNEKEWKDFHQENDKTYKYQVSYADCIKKGELSVQYRPTLDMIADYFTKWLQGSLFRKLRDLTLGIVPGDFKKYNKRRYISVWRKKNRAEKERKEKENRVTQCMDRIEVNRTINKSRYWGGYEFLNLFFFFFSQCFQCVSQGGCDYLNIWHKCLLNGSMVRHACGFLFFR